VSEKGNGVRIHKEEIMHINHKVRLGETFLVLSLALAGCGVGGKGAPAQPAATPSSSMVLIGTASIATVPPLPVQTLEFSNLKALQKTASFPIWLPGFVPKGLQFQRGYISDYADGSQDIELFYSEPGDLTDINLKTMMIEMSEPGQPISLDSIFNQFKETAWDVREIQVRGQAGFSYWSPCGACSNSAVLFWHEDNVDIHITLFGNWPAPEESHPHSLDEVMLLVAEGLKATP
jgi:hypothetical protein